MSPDEKRRIAIKFGIGEGDLERSEDFEELGIVEGSPEPELLLGPEFLAAITGLVFGNVEPLAEALVSAEPVLPECVSLLALALRGDPRLRFRLIVLCAPLEGQKRAGRPRRGTRLTAQGLAEDIEQGALELDQRRRIVAAALRGDKNLPWRILVKSNSGGRCPARTGERNLILAVKMSSRLRQMQERGERDPYGTAARLVANECLVGSSTVEKAYEQNREVAQDMLKWAGDLRDPFKKLQEPLDL